MKMEQVDCSETSAYKVQTPGNYPEENIQHTEHSKSLKSWAYYFNTSNKLSLNNCPHSWHQYSV